MISSKKLQSIDLAVLDSPEWQAWLRHNELYPEYDVQNSMDTGSLSPEHFDAFLRFATQQYLASMAIKYRPFLSLTSDQIAARIARLSL